MQGEPVAVTARLSNGSGTPGLPDYAPDVRGMAVKFYLPEGRAPTSWPRPRRASRPAPGRTSSSSSARWKRGPSQLWKLPVFLGQASRGAGRAACQRSDTEAAGELRELCLLRHSRIQVGRCRRSRAPPPLPLATGGRRAEPLDRGGEGPWPRLPAGRPIARVSRRGRFASSSNCSSPRTATPSTTRRPDGETTARRSTAGTLELTELDTERETGDDVLVFDPTRVTDGIELSDDPILRFRRDAYSVSIERRSGVAREGP